MVEFPKTLPDEDDRRGRLAPSLGGARPRPLPPSGRLFGGCSAGCRWWHGPRRRGAAGAEGARRAVVSKAVAARAFLLFGAVSLSIFGVAPVERHALLLRCVTKASASLARKH